MSKTSSEEDGFCIDFNEENGWTDDINRLLFNYEHNATVLAEAYKLSYLDLISMIKWFRLPVIVLSSANSIISVGLSAYIQQDMVSSITCVISFICGIITSIELYLGLQKRIEAQILSYRNFYLLSIKINNVMKLNAQNRLVDPMKFLTEVELEYKDLFLDSNVLHRKIKDKLLVIEKKPILNKLLSFTRSP